MHRRRIVALSAATALAAAAGVGIPQLASAKTTTHHLKFHEKQVGKSVDSGPLLLLAENEYVGKKLIGTDEINCHIKGSLGHCLGALNEKGGILYVRFDLRQTSVDGTVTGGAGGDKGATGTIKSVGKTASTIAVTYRK